jgi:hypothetical protein
LSSQGTLSLAWVKQYGPIVRYKGFLQVRAPPDRLRSTDNPQTDHLLVADPKAIVHIFTSGPYKWERDTVNKPRFAAMFGHGLISTVGASLRYRS